MKNKTWSYGVTTVPERLDYLLPKTLQSLKEGGFDSPRIFVDGCIDALPYSKFDLSVTCRYPKMGVAGSWILTAWELFIRNPNVNYYAIFQDDFVCQKNLKEYLESCTYPEDGYWNLYTFPQNEQLRKPNQNGWYLSNQRGRGAVALVFNRDTLLKLFASPEFTSKPCQVRKPTKNMDGCIINALSAANVREWVHYPSLVQHTGIESTAGNREFPSSQSFPGEKTDLMKGIPNADD